ncbi:DUF4342 domain-containing protein [Sphingobacterium sp. Mn56C]|uniref:DUF4342 domain-containing protein n=1 Tax=Sphingobacterium sp. Mn56C TaxID=3395261 RepID=UPI003BC4D768
MANYTSIFTINSASITNAFQNIFDTLQDSKFRLESRSGNLLLDIPLILAVVILLLFPVLLVGMIILGAIGRIHIRIRKRIFDTNPKNKDLEPK